MNLDEERLEQAMKLLGEIAKERQVILFSCRRQDNALPAHEEAAAKAPVPEIAEDTDAEEKLKSEENAESSENGESGE